MLPSSQRLSRQQITALLADPQIKVVFNRIGTLKYRLSPGYALSVVTGSKNQKKAVLRNKLRRQLYSLARIENTPEMEGILYVSKQIYDLSFQELKDAFHALLSKTAKNS